LSEAGEYLRRVTQDGDGPSGYAIGVDKGRSLDVIPAVPADGKRGIGFFNLDRLAFASMSQPCGQPVGGVEQPGIAGLGGEQDELRDGNDPAVARRRRVAECSAPHGRGENFRPSRSASPVPA